MYTQIDPFLSERVLDTNSRYKINHDAKEKTCMTLYIIIIMILTTMILQWRILDIVPGSLIMTCHYNI